MQTGKDSFVSIRESVNNEVTKFIQSYVYRDQELEGIIENRMRQYNEIKTKTTQVILPDLNSLTQRIKRANIQASYWVHFMTKDIQKCDPCLSSWKCEEETETLIPLWYGCNQLLHSICKRCRLSVYKIAQTQRTAVFENDIPKRPSAAVAKINIELRDTDSDNENDTDFSHGLSDFVNESNISDTNSIISCS